MVTFFYPDLKLIIYKKKSIYVSSQYLENKKLRKKNEEIFSQNRYFYERLTNILKYVGFSL
jgi:hypothetical protein